MPGIHIRSQVWKKRRGSCATGSCCCQCPFFPRNKSHTKTYNLAGPLLLTVNITSLQICKRAHHFLATALTRLQGTKNRLACLLCHSWQHLVLFLHACGSEGHRLSLASGTIPQEPQQKQRNRKARYSPGHVFWVPQQGKGCWEHSERSGTSIQLQQEVSYSSINLNVWDISDTISRQ